MLLQSPSRKTFSRQAQFSRLATDFPDSYIYGITIIAVLENDLLCLNNQAVIPATKVVASATRASARVGP